MRGTASELGLTILKASHLFPSRTSFPTNMSFNFLGTTPVAGQIL